MVSKITQAVFVVILFKWAYELGVDKYKYEKFYEGIRLSTQSLIHEAKKNEIFDLEYINRENMHRSDHLTNIKRKRIHAQCICVFYFLC